MPDLETVGFLRSARRSCCHSAQRRRPSKWSRILRSRASSCLCAGVAGMVVILAAVDGSGAVPPASPPWIDRWCSMPVMIMCDVS